MKTAYDYKHVKGTTAIALIKDGKQAGKIVANWSDNSAGTVCTATIHISYNEETYTGTGRAGGYGYDKLSSAIYEALKNAETPYRHNKEKKDLSKVYKVEPGSGNQRNIFTDAGFVYVDLLG